MEHLIEILIPSLTERNLQRMELLKRLIKLDGYISSIVKISTNIDNREKTTGAKRNELLQSATAEYICFLDDDDNVSDDYFIQLLAAAKSGYDCASLIGSIQVSATEWRPFIHSIKYNSWFEDKGIYYRPPNHLNLIRRDIAQQFKFEDLTIGEDHIWSQQISDAGVLKTEYQIPTTIYYYNAYKP